MALARSTLECGDMIRQLTDFWRGGTTPRLCRRAKNMEQGERGTASRASPQKKRIHACALQRACGSGRAQKKIVFREVNESQMRPSRCAF